MTLDEFVKTANLRGLSPTMRTMTWGTPSISRAAMGGAAGTRRLHAMRISRGSGWCPYCQLDGWHWRGCPEAPENEDEIAERDPMETDPEERGMTCPG